MNVIRGVVGSGAQTLASVAIPSGRKWSRFEGNGWRFEVAQDCSGRLLQSEQGVLLHDGRVESAAAPVLERSGSWLEIGWGDAGELIFTSDRIGTVPLFWGVKGGATFFSTRLVDMLGFGFSEPDPSGMLQMLLFNHPLHHRTLLKGVSLLPPSSKCSFDCAGLTKSERYWRPFANREMTGLDEGLIDRGVEVVRTAIDRALDTRSPGPLAWPVTAGFDARCILGASGHRLDVQDCLFHVVDMGNHELPIARKIARSCGKNLLEIDSAHLMRNVLSFELGLDSGEFNVGHWRLVGASRQLANDGFAATVDGYLQDSLLNPHMFFNASREEERQRFLHTAQYRIGLLGLNGEDLQLKSVLNEYMDLFPEAESGVEASQRFVIENRSRRMIYGIVRLNANFLDVRTPGLDKDLIEFGMSLPWAHRQGGAVYAGIINRISPELAAIEYDKTGLPLHLGSGLSRRKKMKRLASYYANRLWPGNPFFVERETAFEKLLRTDREWRFQIYEAIKGSEWITAVFGSEIVENIERMHSRGKYPYDSVGALLTIALLNRAAA